jgi:transglutaminase-like putative cysteine protease
MSMTPSQPTTDPTTDPSGISSSGGDRGAAALTPTAIVDSDHPAVREFAEVRSAGARSPKETAIQLYYAVRDEIRYDPYGAGVSVTSLRASATLELGRGWCVSKAVVLAAACRAVGIPARLGFADVRNHLSTARMREHMKTDVFYWHGYTAMRLGADEAAPWVKATPAFNIELCERFGFPPLDFDGEQDSLYHPFDLEGRRHMEYLNDRGQFDDVPLEAMRATFLEAYPGLDFDGGERAGEAFGAQADFDRDVDAELARD